MENTIQPQAHETLDRESLYVASLILQDVHAIIQDVHILVATLLRYVEIGTAVADSLIRLTGPAVSEGNGL